MKLLDEVEPSEYHEGGDYPLYSLEKVKERFKVVELVEGNFWAAVDCSETWANIAFLEFERSYEGEDDILVTRFF